MASREIQPLETVMIDAPCVAGPNHKTDTVCLQCLKFCDGLYKCLGCGYPMCCEECSEAETHAKECRLLSLIKDNDNTASSDDNNNGDNQEDHNYKLIMTLRLFLIKQANDIKWTQIAKLIDHEEERKENAAEWQMFQESVVDKIKMMIPTATDEELHNMVGIICINAVGFDFKKEKMKGRALYPTLSVVSHSCISNTRFNVSPDDLSVVLRARRLIEEGEEITISYVPTIFGQPKRRQHINEEWYFDCKCPRCSDPTEFGTYTSALKCSRCREGLILPHPNKMGDLWKCRFCDNPFEPEYIATYVQSLEDELYAISKSDPTPQKLEAFLKGHFKDLHPKHFLNLIAQRNLIQVLGRESTTNRDTLSKLIKYCRAFKATMSRLDPGYSEWLGFTLKKLNMATLTLLKMDLQDKRVDKNSFAEKSEAVWASMKDVENCDKLCGTNAR